MECPSCGSKHIRKNGHRANKQNHICVDCGRQFIDRYSSLGYGKKVKKICLNMYVNGMGFRSISRVTGVAHSTLINWVKEVGESLPDNYEPKTIPEVGELDELETFISKKK